MIKKKTSKSRFTRAVRSIYQWCKTHRHQPIGQQHRTLCQKVRGHCAYYGLTGNYFPLRAFRRMVHRVWRKWLARRNRSKKLSWAKFNRMLEKYPLPGARVVHSVYRVGAAYYVGEAASDNSGAGSESPNVNHWLTTCL